MVNRQEQEKRFLKWVESRDDDWWEDEARISIWDFRVMQEFFNEDLLTTLTEFERETKERIKLCAKEQSCSMCMESLSQLEKEKHT